MKHTLPRDSAARKEHPLAEGLLYYFPAACAAVAAVSKVGNDKHNPGEPLHHARGKSMDHADCILRHMIDMREGDGRDADGVPEVAYLAWRAMALAQEWLEQHADAPLAPNAWTDDAPAAEAPAWTPPRPWSERTQAVDGTEIWYHPSGAYISRDADGLWDYRPAGGKWREGGVGRVPTGPEAVEKALAVSVLTVNAPTAEAPLAVGDHVEHVDPEYAGDSGEITQVLPSKVSVRWRRRGEWAHYNLTSLRVIRRADGESCAE